jgi:hypothetical protein
MEQEPRPCRRHRVVGSYVILTGMLHALFVSLLSRGVPWRPMGVDSAVSLAVKRCPDCSGPAEQNGDDAPQCIRCQHIFALSHCRTQGCPEMAAARSDGYWLCRGGHTYAYRLCPADRAQSFQQANGWWVCESLGHHQFLVARKRCMVCKGFLHSTDGLAWSCETCSSKAMT